MTPQDIKVEFLKHDLIELRTRLEDVCSKWSKLPKFTGKLDYTLQVGN